METTILRGTNRGTRIYGQSLNGFVNKLVDPKLMVSLMSRHDDVRWGHHHGSKPDLNNDRPVEIANMEGGGSEMALRWHDSNMTILA